MTVTAGRITRHI